MHEIQNEQWINKQPQKCRNKEQRTKGQTNKHQSIIKLKKRDLQNPTAPIRRGGCRARHSILQRTPKATRGFVRHSRSLAALPAVAHTKNMKRAKAEAEIIRRRAEAKEGRPRATEGKGKPRAKERRPRATCSWRSLPNTEASRSWWSLGGFEPLS